MIFRHGTLDISRKLSKRKKDKLPVTPVLLKQVWQTMPKMLIKKLNQQRKRLTLFKMFQEQVPLLTIIN